jgi:hypothetical protein
LGYGIGHAGCDGLNSVFNMGDSEAQSELRRDELH